MAIRFFSRSEAYRDFSNFAPYPIEIDGEHWPTTEHYYQAQKFNDPELRELIRNAEKPVIAKTLADKHREVIRPDWAQVKDAVMERALREKFTRHATVRDLLLSSGDEPIIEDNPRDHYWGEGRDGTGENRLGLLLMRLRAELRAFPDAAAAGPG